MAAPGEAQQARELSMEGRRLLSAGDHRQAAQVFASAARAFGEAGDLRLQAAHQRMVADIHLVMEQPEEALAGYQQAQVLTNMGLIEVQSGRGESAISLFRRALELFERAGSTLHVAQQWGNIGSACRDMREYGRAMESYRRAAALYEGLDHAGGRADQYTNMAYVHSMLHEPAEALELYRKAAPLYTQAGDSRKAELTRRNIASLESSLEEGQAQ